MKNLDQIYKNILIYAVAAVFVVGVVVACVGIIPQYLHYRVHAEKDLVEALAARTLSVEQSIARAADVCLQITSRTGIRDYLEKYNSREISRDQLADFTFFKLKDAIDQSENVKGISRFDLEGNLVAQAGLALPPGYTALSVDLDQQVSFSGPVLLQGETYLMAAASIINRENQRIGTDVVLFNGDFIRKVLQDKSGLGATGTAILAMGLDNDALPFFLTGEIRAGDKAVFSVDAWVKSALMAAIDGKKGLLPPKDGSKVVIAYGPVSQSGFGLAISMTSEEIYQPARHVLTFFGGLSTSFILIAIFSTIFVFRPLTSRLKQEFAARKKSEEKLLFFKALVDQAQDAIFIVSPDTGRFIEVNDQAGASLGYTREELLSMKVSDIEIALPDNSSFGIFLEKLRKKGNMLFDGEHRCRDGSCIPVEVNSNRVFLEDQEYLIAAVRDISDKLKARKHAQDLARIIENSLNEVYIFDAKTLNFVVANRGARENLGYSMEELCSLTPIDIKPEFTLDSFKALVQPLVSGKVTNLDIFTIHKRKDGSLYPVESHIQVTTYAGKQAFAAIILDITERKLSEEKLQNYQENLEEKIQDRTLELEKKNQKLESMNKLFVDREFRVKELRTQVERLNKQLNEMESRKKQI